MKPSTHTISVVMNSVVFPRKDWCYNLDLPAFENEIRKMDEQMGLMGFRVEFVRDNEREIVAKGYGDLLNAVRIRSTVPGLGNLCLGHIIGASENLNLLEDVRRGIRRIAFAPETVEPEGSDKVVCHNCGCGC